MFAIICRRRFSKLRISVICGGVFLELKPKVYFLFPSTLGFKKKNAFQLIRLLRGSVFSISVRLYSFSDGNGMFFVEWSNLVGCVKRWFANEDDTCEKDQVDTRRFHSIYICVQVTRVSRANSASLPPRRITNGFTVQALAKCS